MLILAMLIGSQVKGFAATVDDDAKESNQTEIVDDRKIEARDVRGIETREVSNWNDFRLAYRDATVSKIVLTDDIIRKTTDTTLTGTGNNLTRSLEISGVKDPNGQTDDEKYYKLALSNTSLGIAAPTVFGSEIHIHDIILSNAQGGTYSESIIDGGGSYGTVPHAWKYRLGNIVVPDVDVNGNQTRRVARASRAEVRLYGDVSLTTTGENFYIGSVIVEPDAHYIGENTQYNWSTVWYERTQQVGDTGYAGEFNIGENARVDLRKRNGTGSAYPAIYHYYKSITVGKNAVYNAKMPGNAVAFGTVANQTFNAKEGSVVNLTSSANNAVVATTGTGLIAASGARMTIEPGARFYVIGPNPGALVDFSSGSNNRLILDQPAQYDIRNLGTNNTTSRAFLSAGNGNATNSTSNALEILNSDIDLWKMPSDVLGPSDSTYAAIENFLTRGANTAAYLNVSSSVDSLTTDYKSGLGNFRRISGMNQKPVIEWGTVTDADKQIKRIGRVKIGEVPDNEGLRPDGTINYISVYASLNQATVELTDGHTGEKRTVSTDANGYINYDVADFYPAGTKISGVAKRGAYVSEEVTDITVIDITPPEPAKVDNEERVSPISKELSGTGEVNANVTFSLNNIPQPGLSTVVDNQGKWKITLPDGLLKQDDKLQIFLQDKAGKASITNPPITNSDIGNINPKEDLAYRDATFKAGKIVTVNGILTLTSAPANISFGSVSVLDFMQPIGADNGDIDTELIVEDTRGARDKWDVTAQVVEEMTNDGDQLIGAMKYYYNNELLTLTSSPQTIYQNGANDPKLTYNITDGWGKGNDQNGLKFQAKGDVVPKTSGSYTGTIKWTLRDTIE